MDEEVLEITLSDIETRFLKMVNGPINRLCLLDRLERSGLLAAFLEAESGTT